jgi:hypothetical protein
MSTLDDLKDKCVFELTSQICSSREAWLEEICRTKVIPPVKGDITPGKIRWRGLRICTTQGVDTAIPNGALVTMEYVEQRGRTITPMFISEIEFPEL